MLECTFFQHHGSDEVGIADIRSLFAGSGAYEVVLSAFKTVAGTVVQFLTTISTTSETGEHIGFACSGRSAFVFAKFLHTGKGIFVNNRFMGVLENLPLVGRIFEFLFALVRQLACLEVDHVTKVFLLLQYAGDGAWCPSARVIGCVGRSISSHLYPMNRRTIHRCFFQFLGDLRGAIALHAPYEDLTDNGCGFIVHNPMSLWIVGVFHIAVGRVGGQIFTRFTFLLHNRFDLFTAVLDIELIEHTSFGKVKRKQQKCSIHAGLRRDGSRSDTSLSDGQGAEITIA